MQKQLLGNIVIIRLILIILLVFYHAFAPYSGGWNKLPGYPDVPLYWWLDKLSYAFLLEMFVFVSGYVFGFQVKSKGDVLLEAPNLFMNKFKRLLIPSVFFSTIYFFIFRDPNNQSIISAIYDIIQGVGHLWFLPMLFWCFVIIWIVEKLHFRPIIVLITFVFLAILPRPTIPFYLSHSLYYILFFYLGYILQKKSIDIHKFYDPKFIFLFTSLFIILFTLFTIFQQNIVILFAGDAFVYKMIKIILINSSKVIYSFLGIVVVLTVVGYFETKRTRPLNSWIINISGSCMGVYLLHQFFLKAVYDFTNLPYILGPYLLPWFSFILTLIGSLLLTKGIKNFKIGKYLIG